MELRCPQYSRVIFFKCSFKCHCKLHFVPLYYNTRDIIMSRSVYVASKRNPLLSLLLGAAILLCVEAFAIPSSQPVAHFQEQSSKSVSSGSGSYVHYQSLECKKSAEITRTASEVVDALKSMQSNLTRIVELTFTALNYSLSTVPLAIQVAFQFPNLNFTPIHKPNIESCSPDEIVYDQCNISLTVPDMKCIGHLLGEILLDATDVQINTGANNTFRSELYKTYANVNFTVDLERMVQAFKCNTPAACFQKDKTCLTYRELNVTIRPEYFGGFNNLSQLRKVGILYKIEHAYSRLQDVLNHFVSCQSPRAGKK